ncbi:predicted protein [Naegleria gruberi]|uniref:Predicted protein n=1 Tax=Naegleria gruberi TaxID=5762 RepID=D2VK16_NAEGR|nr:uncharacterized protein NAEGRDRAFT_69236 [Naegleria gruberi]EFC42782.1 predicted protein [Naegleria gruberi]|eukprot:XP_002675526.1 predicted protein [Naegleria gruberi strain NEG-M]
MVSDSEDESYNDDFFFDDSFMNEEAEEETIINNSEETIINSEELISLLFYTKHNLPTSRSGSLLLGSENVMTHSTILFTYGGEHIPSRIENENIYILKLSNLINQLSISSLNYETNRVELIWEEIIPNSEKKPIGRKHPCLSYDKSNQLVYLFGGYENGNYLNDLWVFELKSKKWSMIETFGEIPVGRCGGVAKFYSNGMFYVFGGYNHKERTNALFELDLKTREWKQVNYSETIPIMTPISELSYISDNVLTVLKVDILQANMFKFSFNTRQWIIKRYRQFPTSDTICLCWRESQKSSNVGESVFALFQESGIFDSKKDKFVQGTVQVIVEFDGEKDKLILHKLPKRLVEKPFEGTFMFELNMLCWVWMDHYITVQPVRRPLRRLTNKVQFRSLFVLGPDELCLLRVRGKSKTEYFFNNLKGSTKFSDLLIKVQ